MHVAYHANYCVWFEVSRCRLLHSFGRANRETEAGGFMLPATDAHCENRRPARYDDDLTTRIHGRLMWPVRVRFDDEVQRPADQAVTAVGHTAHAGVERECLPTRHPAEIRKVLA